MIVNFDGSGSSDPDGQAIVAYEWDFGDGGFPAVGDAAPTHTYAQPGSYVVTLRVSDGSEWSEPYSAPVAAAQNRRPEAHFTVLTSPAIAGKPVRFANGSSDPDNDALTFQWRFGDGQTSTELHPTVTFSSQGPKEVVLVASDGKTDGEDDYVFYVDVERGNEAPTPSFRFSPSDPEVGQPIEFNSTSGDGDGDPLSYSWDFGDNTTANVKTFSKTYASAGPHTVTLTVSDDRGATSTSEPQTVTVRAANQPPIIEISAAVLSSGPNGMVVQFKNSSRDPEGQQLHYEWTFGDGPIDTQSREASPQYTYAETRNYTATLRVSDGRLQSEGTAEVTAPVNRPPSVSFRWSPAQPQRGEPVTFYSGASDDPGDSLTYAWSFGDGKKSTDMDPTHVYEVMGPVEVTLHVSDGKAGGTSSKTEIVQIGRGNDPPTDVNFTFNPEAPTARQQMMFYGSATDGDGDPLTYSWDFGDGTRGTGKDVPKTYPAAGTWTVQLTVTDSMGASTTSAPRTVKVGEPNRPPTPDFTWKVINATQTSVPVYFDASRTTDLDDDPLTYTWKFGDPRNPTATGTGLQPQYTYPQPGTYTVELSVSDGRSPVVKVSRQVDATINTPVNRRPSAGFTWSPAQPTAGQLVTFTNTSTDPDNDPLTYVWRFPDGTNPTGQNQLYSFATAGTHRVLLDVSDGKFPEASQAEHYITVTEAPGDVNQPPTAKFTYSPNAPLTGQPVTFTDASTDPNNDPLTYSWSFGDGTTSSARNPVKTYSTAGSRVVSLSVSDGRGGANTASKPITISTTDGAAPVLTFDRPSGTVVTTPTFSVTIEVTGDGLDVSTGSVRLNDVDVTASVSTPVTTATRIVANATLQLRVGLNTVVVAVSDTAGRRGQASLSVTYQTGPAGPVLSFNRPSGTTVTDPAFPVVITATGSELVVSTGAIQLNGTPVTSTFAIPEQTSTRVVASGTLQLAPGPNTIVAAMTDATGARGEASLTVTYNNSNAGLANPTVTAPGNMSVTPGASGTVKFQVKNNSTTDRTFAFVATSSNTAVVTDPADPISQVIPAGATIDVPVSASVLSGAAAGATSTIALTATDTANTAKTGSASFLATVAQVDFQLDLSPHNGENFNVAQFGSTLSYTTPAYISMDVPRSVTLFYSSGQAVPKGFVQVDVTDNSAKPAQQYSILLRDKDDKLVPLTTGTTEAFYGGAAGSTRLAAQFDAGTLPTGAYTYTLVVRKWVDGTASERTAPVRVLILNESGSPYGAGWTVAGPMRARRQAEGIVLTTGDGTIQFFPQDRCEGTVCRFSSPNAVFVQSLTADSSGFVLAGHDGSRATFDSSGMLQATADRFGNTSLFRYDAGRLVSIQDPAGKTITLIYDGGRLAEIRDAVVPVRVASLSIDPNNDLREIREPNGSVAVRADYEAHRLTGWSDRLGNRADVVYDAFGWLDRTLSPTVKVRTDAGSDADVRPTTISVSLAAAVLPQPGRGATAATAAPRLASANVRLQVTDPRGQTTRLLPDRFGNPLRVEGPLGVLTTFERDTHSRVTRETQAPTGGTMRNEWHPTLPLLLKQIDETTGIEVSSEYDAAAFHQIKRTFSNRANVPETRYFYDSVGVLERIATFRADGTEVKAQHVSFHPDGRIKSTSDAEGHGTTYEYQVGAWRNLWKVIEAADTPRAHTYEYDAAGRQAKVTLPSDGATSPRSLSTEYDLLNRRWKWWTDLSAIEYDTEEQIGSKRVRTVKDAEGNAHVLTYNALGWLESERDPVQRVTTYRYDAGGLLRERVNRRNQAIQVTYDALGRMKKRLDAATGESTDFEYDPQGRWMQVSNAESVNRFEYDHRGRETHEHVTIGGTTYTLEWAFDDRGIQTELRLKAPWQKTIRYDYDRQLNLSGVVDLSGRTTTFERDEDGALERTVYPNGMSIRYNVSSHHAISGISPLTASLNAVFGTTYGINAQGQVSARWNGTRDRVTSYAYDPVGRLKEVGIHTLPAQPPCESEHSGDCGPVPHISTALSVKYGYDLTGNPAGSTVIAQPANRLRALNGLALDYDNDGNLISQTGNGSSQSFVWDALGQLRQVTTGTAVVTFAYDGLGRRVRKTTPSGVTRYLHNGSNLFLELDAIGNILREYTFLPNIDDPLSVRYAGRTYYYIREVPGHVSGLVDDTGTQAANVYRYDPWGKLTEKQESFPNPLMFGAREYDGETGLYYNRARYYSPALRRFISEDPLRLEGGMNLYAYAANDPVNNTDPSGLTPCTPSNTFKTMVELENAIAMGTTICGGSLAELIVVSYVNSAWMAWSHLKNRAIDLNNWAQSYARVGGPKDAWYTLPAGYKPRRGMTDISQSFDPPSTRARLQCDARGAKYLLSGQAVKDWPGVVAVAESNILHLMWRDWSKKFPTGTAKDFFDWARPELALRHVRYAPHATLASVYVLDAWCNSFPNSF